MTTTSTDVLLVEDNPNDVELALHAFGKHSPNKGIKLARDGQEALDYLFGIDGANAGAPPRVILLDLKLPKIDGREVLREIRASDATKHLPVVVLTTSDQQRDISDSYELGANSYIVKPVDFDQFVDVVAILSRYWLRLNKPPVDSLDA